MGEGSRQLRRTPVGQRRIARLAAKKHKPSEGFRELRDATALDRVAEDIETRITVELSTLKLDQYKRVAFYPLGAGEALLLDRLKTRWQDRYFTDKFHVEHYFNAE